MYTGTLINDLFAAVERARERAEKYVRQRQWHRQSENVAVGLPRWGQEGGPHELEHTRAGNSESE
jgi:hypothetical protein